VVVDLAWLQAEFRQLENLTDLSSGGQKQVFSARRRGSGESVVLKLFHATANPGRAVRELQAVRDLRGQRVPRILDVGTAISNVGDHIYFIEQFVEGETLREITRPGVPDPPDVLKWAEQILTTLAAAEAASIVHRDIKPANVMIDPSGDAWLIDFGIVRYLGLDSFTPTAALVGPHSPGYAPPEQFLNAKREVDPHADLFALGVVLFESLEGHNPYVAGVTSPQEILIRVASMDMPRISVRPGVSDSVADLVQSMTRRPISQRPRSAADALSWLRGG
jgi:serine/threonine-protein kinase